MSDLLDEFEKFERRVRKRLKEMSLNELQAYKRDFSTVAERILAKAPVEERAPLTFRLMVCKSMLDQEIGSRIRKRTGIA